MPTCQCSLIAKACRWYSRGGRRAPRRKSRAGSNPSDDGSGGSRDLTAPPASASSYDITIHFTRFYCQEWPTPQQEMPGSSTHCILCTLMRVHNLLNWAQRRKMKQSTLSPATQRINHRRPPPFPEHTQYKKATSLFKIDEAEALHCEPLPMRISAQVD